MGLLDTIGGFASDAFDTVENVASDAVDGAENLASDAVDTVENVASDAYEVASDAVDTAENVASDAVDTAENVASDAYHEVRSDAEGAYDAVADEVGLPDHEAVENKVVEVAEDAYHVEQDIADSGVQGMKWLGEGVNKAVDWGEKEAHEAGNWVKETTHGIPVLEQVGEGAAFVGETYADFEGGVLRGATGMVTGLGTMAYHPLDAVTGLAKLGYHAAGAELDEIEAGYDMAANGMSPEEAFAKHHSKDTQYMENAIGGMLKPITDQAANGNYADASGQVAVQVAALLCGGEAGEAGEAADGAEAAQAAETANAAEAAEAARIKPIEPIEPVEPVEPIEPVEPVEPEVEGQSDVTAHSDDAGMGFGDGAEGYGEGDHGEGDYGDEYGYGDDNDVVAHGEPEPEPIKGETEAEAEIEAEGKPKPDAALSKKVARLEGSDAVDLKEYVPDEIDGQEVKVGEQNEVDMSGKDWRDQLAQKGLTKGDQEFVYAIRDAEGNILKVGKTEAATIEGRFSAYSNAQNYGGSKITIDVLEAEPPEGMSIERVEGETRSGVLDAENEGVPEGEQNKSLPWDNTNQRLGRSGPGTPGATTRAMRNNGQYWDRETGQFMNSNEPMTPAQQAEHLQQLDELLTETEGDLDEVSGRTGVPRREIERYLRDMDIDPDDYTFGPESEPPPSSE